MPTPTFETLGDPHLGRQFIHGVPLERRGEREKMVIDQFYESLLSSKADYHICMGDLFDKSYVPYDLILQVANMYRAAASMNKKTTYVILKGNHDWMRDLDRISAFDLFTELVKHSKNIATVEASFYTGQGLKFFGWHPTIPAKELVQIVERDDIVFGHWDTAAYPDAPTTNLVPYKELAELGVKTVYNGHVHRPHVFTNGGVTINVVGSMQPYAHGEEVNDSLYITIPFKDLNRYSSDSLRNRCVRVVLSGDDVLDRPISCLQLTVKREISDEPLPEVSLGEFNMEALFAKALADAKVSPEVTKQLGDRFNMRKTAGGN